MLQGVHIVLSRSWAQAEWVQAVLRSGDWVKEGLARFFLQLHQICIQTHYLCMEQVRIPNMPEILLFPISLVPTSCTLKPPWHLLEAA